MINQTKESKVGAQSQTKSSKTTVKSFRLLSIGQRGVGKTVFLAGSYAELHSDRPRKSAHQLWFDCQDAEAQAKIETILQYMTMNGKYPPLTMKVADFNFSLKQPSRQGTKTLCHFLWSDIPGEICQIENRDFAKMVSTSHGCCAFIDAYALMHQPEYQQKLQATILPLMAIANLVQLNKLKYAFAIILTKCDLLESDAMYRQKLTQKLQPLSDRLQAMKVDYQIFHSSIPIVAEGDTFRLDATDAANPLLWLVQELYKIHQIRFNALLTKVTRPLIGESQEKREDGIRQRLYNVNTRKKSDQKAFYILAIALSTLTIIGISGFLLSRYLPVFQSARSNQMALSTENLEQIRLRLELAQIYQVTGQFEQAETLYDEILALQPDNFSALLGKATLRHAQGDTQAARSLFKEAEKAAPRNLKSEVRSIAKETLQPVKSE